jgi:hypothetical protein
MLVRALASGLVTTLEDGLHPGLDQGLVVGLDVRPVLGLVACQIVENIAGRLDKNIAVTATKNVPERFNRRVPANSRPQAGDSAFAADAVRADYTVINRILEPVVGQTIDANHGGAERSVCWEGEFYFVTDWKYVAMAVS